MHKCNCHLCKMDYVSRAAELLANGVFCKKAKERSSSLLKRLLFIEQEIDKAKEIKDNKRLYRLYKIRKKISTIEEKETGYNYYKIKPFAVLDKLQQIIKIKELREKVIRGRINAPLAPLEHRKEAYAILANWEEELKQIDSEFE